MCSSMGQGRLGFRKISLRNSALPRKWLWKFPREKNGLWRKVIVFMGHVNLVF